VVKPWTAAEAQLSIDHVQAWLDAERAYGETKFPLTQNDEMLRRSGLGRDGEWMGFILNYLLRASVLGPDNPLGRQALAKALRTTLALTETVVRLHGPLPDPGVPSGDGLPDRP
jgi:hypothetical protein